MSRSTKKFPSIGDDDSHIRKKRSSKKFRRINKILISKNEQPLLKEEVTNPYDIVDYKFTDYKNLKENRKHKRK